MGRGKKRERERISFKWINVWRRSTLSLSCIPRLQNGKVLKIKKLNKTEGSVTFELVQKVCQKCYSDF